MAVVTGGALPLLEEKVHMWIFEGFFKPVMAVIAESGNFCLQPDL